MIPAKAQERRRKLSETGHECQYHVSKVVVHDNCHQVDGMQSLSRTWTGSLAEFRPLFSESEGEFVVDLVKCSRSPDVDRVVVPGEVSNGKLWVT